MNAIEFPVLRLSQGLVRVARKHENLTRCTKAALKSGWFKGMILVDARGRRYHVSGARKLRGVGPFWGYNVFLNQKIEVELDLEEATGPAELEWLRSQILKSFRSWHGWSSRGDFGELKKSVERAGSVPELVRVLEVATRPIEKA